MAPVSLLSAFPQLSASNVSFAPTTATSDFPSSFTGYPAPSITSTDHGVASFIASGAARIPEVIDEILTSQGNFVEVKDPPTATEAVNPVPTVSQIIEDGQAFVQKDGKQLAQKDVRRIVDEHRDREGKILVHPVAISGAKYVEYLLVFVVGSAVGAVILACIDECRSNARDKKDKKED